ncbi:MAG: hypothetical protein KC561_14780, partial [Myxococcales bacterium]|nr:hypothetical protein [Myxococcales bacterium]
MLRRSRVLVTLLVLIIGALAVVAVSAPVTSDRSQRDRLRLRAATSLSAFLAEEAERLSTHHRVASLIAQDPEFISLLRPAVEPPAPADAEPASEEATEADPEAEADIPEEGAANDPPQDPIDAALAEVDGALQAAAPGPEPSPSLEELASQQTPRSRLREIGRRARAESGFPIDAILVMNRSGEVVVQLDDGGIITARPTEISAIASVLGGHPRASARHVNGQSSAYFSAVRVSDESGALLGFVAVAERLDGDGLTGMARQLGADATVFVDGSVVSSSLTQGPTLTAVETYLAGVAADPESYLGRPGAVGASDVLSVPDRRVAIAAGRFWSGTEREGNLGVVLTVEEPAIGSGFLPLFVEVVTGPERWLPLIVAGLLCVGLLVLSLLVLGSPEERPQPSVPPERLIRANAEAEPRREVVDTSSFRVFSASA